MVFRGYKDWHVEFLDDKVERLTGYKVEDFASGKMKWSDIISSEDMEAARRVFIEALKTDKSYVRDYRIGTKSGHLLWIRERGQIVCDEAGEIKYVDGVFFDITEQKESEQAIVRSSEKFKQFAYSVMHDLKSPAIGIHGLTELLHKQYRDSLDDKGRKYCEQILKASVHLAALVEMINSYIAAKESQLSLDKIDVKEVLKTVREQFSSRLTVRQIDWVEPEVLPAVKADKLSLHRMLSNLVDNALKYGGQDLSQITIGYEECERIHIFSVCDNGAGIEERDLERIFSQFQRGVTPRATEGTGLGLAIVRELAERHGGEIWAEPGRDQGTTFYVSLAKNPKLP
jgi:PAS domain S-box-containing protein